MLTERGQSKLEVQYTVSSAKETGKSNSFKFPVEARAFVRGCAPTRKYGRVHEPKPKKRNPTELWERVAHRRGGTSNNCWGMCIAMLTLGTTESAACTQPASHRQHDDHERAQKMRAWTHLNGQPDRHTNWPLFSAVGGEALSWSRDLCTPDIDSRLLHGDHP